MAYRWTLRLGRMWWLSHFFHLDNEMEMMEQSWMTDMGQSALLRWLWPSLSRWWKYSSLHFALALEATGYSGGTESVSLGFHDSVQKRMPVSDLSDRLVQAAFKMICPTVIIWSSTFLGIKILTAFLFHQFLHSTAIPSASWNVMGLYLAFDH